MLRFHVFVLHHKKKQDATFSFFLKKREIGKDGRLMTGRAIVPSCLFVPVKVYI